MVLAARLGYSLDFDPSSVSEVKSVIVSGRFNKHFCVFIHIVSQINSTDTTRFKPFTFLNLCSVVSNPDVEMEVTHEEEKVKDAPLVSEQH